MGACFLAAHLSDAPSARSQLGYLTPKWQKRQNLLSGQHSASFRPGCSINKLAGESKKYKNLQKTFFYLNAEPGCGAYIYEQTHASGKLTGSAKPKFSFSCSFRVDSRKGGRREAPALSVSSHLQYTPYESRGARRCARAVFFFSVRRAPPTPVTLCGLRAFSARLSTPRGAAGVVLAAGPACWRAAPASGRPLP